MPPIKPTPSIPPEKKPKPAEIDFLYGVIEKVGVFRQAFDQPCPWEWNNCSPTAMNMQAGLIREEFDEFVTAKTRVDKLDALCDLAYVIAGGFIACGYRGLALENCSNVHERPFIKVIPDAAKRLTDADCPGGCLRDVGSALFTVVRTGRRLFGVGNFTNAFLAVHANNMNKLWTVGQHAAEFDATTMTSKLVTMDHGASPDRYLVKRKSDGKVIKPSDFVKVELTQFAEGISDD